MMALYVVQRRAIGSDDRLAEYHYRAEGWVPVRAFQDRDAAEALCRKLEEMARRELCPFDLIRGGPSGLAGYAAEQCLPKPGKDLRGWWRDVIGTLEPYQREAIWEMCGLESVYRVGAVIFRP